MKRYRVIDFIRGFALINMIIYHGLWDAVFIFGADIPWYRSEVGHIWQQLICMTFILVSGFCWSMSSKHLKNGAIIIGCSAIVSFVTAFLMPENIILFGILSLIGSSILLMIPLDRICSGINPYVGALIALLLFIFTQKITAGVVGVGDITFFEVPSKWYANLFTAYIGFPPKGFVSMDYFALVPWVFLYQTGYFLNKIFNGKNLLERLRNKTVMPVEWFGRNSLLIYMLHQPLAYAVVWCIFKLI